MPRGTGVVMGNWGESGWPRLDGSGLGRGGPVGGDAYLGTRVSGLCAKYR